MLVIMLDGDLTHSIQNYEFGIGVILKSLIDWLVDSVDHAVKNKKDALKKNKRGSYSSAEPKIIYVTMMH